jgi:fermentation-respiration switch protein FrsA (DUF1100 family)
VSSAFVWNRVITTAAAIVIAYLLVLLLARIYEAKLIFAPDYPGRLSGDWQPKGLPVEDVWIDTAYGGRLHGWWIPNEAATLTFIAFHGNAANITNRAEVYKFLRSLPANVMAVEYRGYGKSTGEPSEAALYEDAESAYDYLVKTRHVLGEHIISFGQSLGTGVAVDLATRRKVRAIILEAPFASMKSVAKRLLPYTPGIGLLAKSKFETARKLGEIKVPVLVVSCKNDPVLPSVLHEEVFRAAHEPKSFLQISGTCHEEASVVAPEEYRLKLSEFLNLARN